MKTFLLALTLLIAATTGCETEGQKMLDRQAAEQTAAAKESLELGQESYNLGECYRHLGVDELTAYKSRKWRAFKKSHHIDGTPTAMSDADLKDCEAL